MKAYWFLWKKRGDNEFQDTQYIERKKGKEFVAKIIRSLLG